MALFQPSNVIPSNFAGINNVAVDVSNNVNISWQVNGNSPMTAFQIKFYDNSNGQKVCDTGIVSSYSALPFNPVDSKGNPQQFTYTANHAWSSNDTTNWDVVGNHNLANGNEYKMVITQWWGSDTTAESTTRVTQWSGSVFLTRATPMLNINENTITTVSKTFTATYSQAQGDSLTWVRWRLYQIIDSQSVLIDDTGNINTNLLSYTYEGFINGEIYQLFCDIETENQVVISTNTSEITASYSEATSSGDFSATCQNDGSVLLSWGKATNIPGTPSASSPTGYTIDTTKNEITINDSQNVVWNTVDSESMNFATPYTIGWKGFLCHCLLKEYNLTATATESTESPQITVNQTNIETFSITSQNTGFPTSLLNATSSIKVVSGRVSSYNRFIAYAYYNQFSAIAAYSNDGLTWNIQTSGHSIYELTNDIAYGNGRFVLCGEDYMDGNVPFYYSSSYSSTQTTWTRCLQSGTGLTNSGYNWQKIIYGNNKFVAVGYNTSNGLVVANSTQNSGITWQLVTATGLPLNMTIKSLIYANGYYWLVLQSNNQEVFYVYRSSNNTAWTLTRTLSGTTLSDIAYTNGTLAILYQENGTLNCLTYKNYKWTSTPFTNYPPIDNNSASLKGELNKFIVTICNNTISSTGNNVNYVLSSIDGVTWTSNDIQNNVISYNNLDYSKMYYGFGKYFWYNDTPAPRNATLYYSNNAVYSGQGTYTTNNKWLRSLTTNDSKVTNIETEQTSATSNAVVTFTLNQYTETPFTITCNATLLTATSSASTTDTIAGLNRFERYAKTPANANVTLTQNGDALTINISVPTATKDTLTTPVSTQISMIAGETLSYTGTSPEYACEILTTNDIEVKIVKTGDNTRNFYGFYVYKNSSPIGTTSITTANSYGNYDLYAVVLISQNTCYFALVNQNNEIISYSQTGMTGYTQPNLTSITLYGKQVCDWLYISNSANAITNIVNNNFQPSWNANTLFLADFIDDLQAGTLSGGSVNTSLRNGIYRKDKNGKLSIIYRPTTNITSLQDYAVVSKNSYSYELYYLSDGGEYSTPSKTDDVCLDFHFYTLIEAEQDETYPTVYHVVKVWKFGNNISAGSISNNNTPNWLTNFTHYRRRQPTSRLGESGTLQALLRNYDTSTNLYQDTAEQMQELKQASISNNTFFIKDMKGNLYMVGISNPIVQTIDTKSNIQEVTVSIPWEEVEDASKVSLIKIIQ